MSNPLIQSRDAFAAGHPESMAATGIIQAAGKHIGGAIGHECHQAA